MNTLPPYLNSGTGADSGFKPVMTPALPSTGEGLAWQRQPGPRRLCLHWFVLCRAAGGCTGVHSPPATRAAEQMVWVVGRR